MMDISYDAIDVRFGELLLKGRNLGRFIDILKGNIKSALSSENYEKIVQNRDRFLIMLSDKSNTNRIIERLRYIPGVSIISPIIFTDPNINSIITASAKFKFKNGSVRIEAHRSDKSHAFNSKDIISAFIKNQGKNKFEIDKNGIHTLYVNLMRDKALLYIKRIKGIGGLPVGSSGNCALLLSGGIDSPVASIMAMRRGLYPIYLHFHAFSTKKEIENSKIPKLLLLLSKYSKTSEVYYIPSHLFIAATSKIPESYELVLFKRFMYKLAERICSKHDINTIITGESIGQVASQTIDNMLASQKGIDKLILRPLAGMDKDEIIKLARQMETFEISIKPYREVCSMKIKNPGTKIPSKIIDRLYKNCKLDECIIETEKRIKKATLRSIR